jgi:hypothetical protein
MGLRKSFAALCQRFSNNIDAVVFFRADYAIRIQQQISRITAKIEHRLTAPIGIVQLLVKVGKLSGPGQLKAKRSLLG